MSEFTEQNLQLNKFTSDSWVVLNPIERSIKSKIERIGKPLKDWDIQINYGIKTGYNEAFIIDEKTKDELIKKSPKSAEVIRPILRGRDIKRYKADFADLWLLNIHNGTPTTPPVNIDDYPEIKAHLDQFYPALEKRQDKGITPYNLRSCIYTDDFSKQKIVWGNLCLNAQYAFAEEGIFVNAPSTMIVPGNKYLLGVLNSRVSDFYIRQLGVTRNGGYFEYKPMFVSQLPIPEPELGTRQDVEYLVDTLLKASKNTPIYREFELKLNKKVYDIYKLSEDEISFIELVL